MELTRLPSSALRFSDVRCRQIIASPPHTIKQYLGVSNYRSSSHILPSHIALSLPTQKNKIAFSFCKSCLKLSTNGTPWLKAIPVKAHTQETASKYELPQKNDVVWRFLRPFLACLALIPFSSILIRRLVESPHALQQLTWSMLVKIFAAFTSIVCANFFISGINQIFDIEIDRINKPDLPLSSGELSIELGWVMVLSLMVICLFISGILNSVPFLVFNILSLLWGAVYSIPPIRTKASTIGAPITLAMLQGSGNIPTIFAGVGAALGLPFQMSSPIMFTAIFATTFTFAMGILKDISDIEGDKKSNIPTLATILGARKTLLIGVGIQILVHFGAALVAIVRPELFKSNIMVPEHILSSFYLLYQAWQMEQANYESTQSRQIHLRMWFAYFAHYFLLPFI